MTAGHGVPQLDISGDSGIHPYPASSTLAPASGKSFPAAWGAVPGLLLARFPRPRAEPGKISAPAGRTRACWGDSTYEALPHAPAVAALADHPGMRRVSKTRLFGPVLKTPTGWRRCPGL